MKRLLVLAIVLRMTAAANAAIVASLVGDNTLGSGDISLIVTTYTAPDIDGFMTITINGSGSLTSSLGPDAPTDAEFVGTMAENDLDSPYGNGDIYNMISYTSTYPPGVWINAHYTGADISTVITAYASVDGIEWTIMGQMIYIPEPGTIALLCLGGLMLRRRK